MAATCSENKTMTIRQWLSSLNGTTASGSEGTTQSLVPLTNNTFACKEGAARLIKKKPHWWTDHERLP
jgi:hypothetical protein